MKEHLVLYAPNVHTGGGLVLLKELLDSWSGDNLTLFLDFRTRNRLEPPCEAKIFWVKPSFASRIWGEVALLRKSKKGTKILCFHGLPPLLHSCAHVIVFLQNRNYIGTESYSNFTLKTCIRLFLERFFGRLFSSNVSEYIVQTPSMKRALIEWGARFNKGALDSKIEVIPFANRIINNIGVHPNKFQWDFIYIADGEGHKNHRNLILAWQLLAAENLRPSLGLTLSVRDQALKFEVDELRKNSLVKVFDLGQMSRDNIFLLYADARALIFPSISESFGLPLIEASALNLPILASELDYVRDVCVPVETFDPGSPVSIARAVKRFLGCPEPTLDLKQPTEVWDALRRNRPPYQNLNL